MVEAVPPVAPATGGVLRSILPERSVEDVLAGRLRMTLGGTVFDLPVLTIAQADTWREKLLAAFGDVMNRLESEVNVAGIIAFLGTNTPTMLTLIHDYDRDAILPDDDYIRGHATEPEVLRGFVLILAASFPFIASAIDILATNPQALGMVLSEFKTPAGAPTSISPSPTGGPSEKPARRSRTSNSPST